MNNRSYKNGQKATTNWSAPRSTPSLHDGNARFINLQVVHPVLGSAGRWLGSPVRMPTTLEEAIRKMTSLSADTFKLKGRDV